MKTKVFSMLVFISTTFMNCMAQSFLASESGTNRVNFIMRGYENKQPSKIFNSAYTPGARDLIADPKAEKILRKYISARGSKKSIAGIENMVSKVEVEFVEPGIVIYKEIIEEKSGKTYIKAIAPQTGEIIRGFDGDVLWEKRQSGIRVISGEERTSFLNESAFLRFCNWKKNLTELEYSGIEKVEGADLHKITVKTIYGSKETWYFNTSDNLLTRMEERLQFQNEESVIITTFEDYRQVEGVMHSFTQHIYLQGQTRKISYTEIKHNQEVDKAIFTKPVQ